MAVGIFVFGFVVGFMFGCLQDVTSQVSGTDGASGIGLRGVD